MPNAEQLHVQTCRYTGPPYPADNHKLCDWCGLPMEPGEPAVHVHDQIDTNEWWHDACWEEGRGE